jgi:hypothetical protein
MPPAKKQQPSTRSEFDRIEPIIADCTTRISPLTSALQTTGQLSSTTTLDVLQDSNDEFHSIAERGVQEATKSVPNLHGDLLGSKAQQSSKGDNGQARCDEDDCVIDMGEVQSKCNRHLGTA